MTSNLLEIKNAALSWLKPVNKETLKWFRTDLKVQKKADQSPVTIADFKAEEILRKQIKKNFPNHGIIGEEFGEEDIQREWVWTIDPIDGTRSFVRGLPFYSTLLSLLQNGNPVLGVMSLPALGETAWAVKRHGAFCNDSPMKVSRQNSLKKSTLATADIYCFKEKKRMRLFNQLQKVSLLTRTYPDAFGHLMAIRGIVDAMVDPWAFIWDFAPIKIMAEEAGGAFLNFSGKTPNLTEGSALVGNKKLVREIKSLLV